MGEYSLLIKTPYNESTGKYIVALILRFLKEYGNNKYPGDSIHSGQN